MLVISIPKSRLKHFGLHERSTDQEWLEAVAGKVWLLGERAVNQRVVAILTGEKAGSPADLVTLASIRTKFRNQIELTREPLKDAAELRKHIRDSRLVLTKNPIQYLDLYEELNHCACGCGERTKGTFASGHDQKAIHDRIRRYFGGDVLTAITEMDRVFGSKEQ